MSKPDFWYREAKSTEPVPSPSIESLVDQGDMPVNVQDLRDDVEIIADYSFVEEGEVEQEDLLKSQALLLEGVAYAPQAMYPYETIRPKERLDKELKSYG